MMDNKDILIGILEKSSICFMWDNNNDWIDDSYCLENLAENVVEYSNQQSKAHLEAIKSLAIQANRKPSGLEEIINYCNEQLKGL